MPDLCLAPQCDRPSSGGHLCPGCLTTLRRDLDSVPDLCADLEVTISRQDRLSSSDGRGADERPLPLRLGPMEARRDLTTTLRAWAHHIATRRGMSLLATGPVELAEWLGLFLGDVQADPHAGDLADEVGYAVITAWRAVDKPLQPQFVGPCDECGGDLYAHRRAKEVACRNCDSVYDVHARREWLLERAESHLLTATEMSRALPGLLDVPLTASMIRGWAHRGRLTPHPPHPERPRDPLYVVREVLDLLHATRRVAG